MLMPTAKLCNCLKYALGSGRKPRLGTMIVCVFSLFYQSCIINFPRRPLFSESCFPNVVLGTALCVLRAVTLQLCLSTGVHFDLQNIGQFGITNSLQRDHPVALYTVM